MLNRSKHFIQSLCSLSRIILWKSNFMALTRSNSQNCCYTKIKSASHCINIAYRFELYEIMWEKRRLVRWTSVCVSDCKIVFGVLKQKSRIELFRFWNSIFCVLREWVLNTFKKALHQWMKANSISVNTSNHLEYFYYFLSFFF